MWVQSGAKWGCFPRRCEGLDLMTSAAANSGWNVGNMALNGAAPIWKVHSALTLVQIGCAGASVLQKFTFEAGANIIVFSVYRDVVSVSCLLLMAYFSERGVCARPDWKTLSLIVLLGFIGVYAAQLVLVFGISLAPSSYSCLIGISTPIFAFVIAAASGLEEVHWTKWGGQAKIVGVLSAACGGVVITLYNGPEILPSVRGVQSVPLTQFQQDIRGVLALSLFNIGVEDWQLGAFFLILCGFLFALYCTLQAYIVQTYPAPVSISALASVFGALMLVLTGLLIIRDTSEWAVSLGPVDIISILYVGLIPSGVNFALQSWALLQSGPVLVAAYTSLQSFTSIAMAYLFLGDSIHLGSVLGLLCIVNGLFLINWGQVATRKEAGDLTKTLPRTLEGNRIINGDTNLEQHLLG